MKLLNIAGLRVRAWIIAHKLLVIQLLCWLGYFCIIWLGTTLKFPNQQFTVIVAVFALKVLVFYAVLALLFYIFHPKHWYKGLLGLLLLFAIATPVSYVYFYKLLHPIGWQVAPLKPPFDQAYIGRMVSRYILMVVLAAGFFAFLKYRNYKNKGIELLAQQYKAEKYALMLRNEVDELRYSSLLEQVNPHFIYNMFNLFFSELLKVSPEWAGLLAKFSDLLRYTFEHAANGMRRVVIEKEWQQILNLLALQSARFPDIHIQEPLVVGAFSGHKLVPFALITLLENAFKYGDFSNNLYPLKLELVLDSKKLFFSCSNLTDHEAVRSASTGTGLTNLKRRLEIEFEHEHQLHIKNDGMVFSVELTIYQ